MVSISSNRHIVDANYIWQRRKKVGNIVGYVALWLGCINTIWIWNHPSSNFAYNGHANIRSQIRAIEQSNGDDGAPPTESYGYDNYYGGDSSNEDFDLESNAFNPVEEYHSKSIFDVQEKLALDTLDSSKSIGPRFQCLDAIRKRHHDVLTDILDKRNVWGDKILLVDPAYHGNVGDHMLTLGEIEFVKGLKYELLQCDLIQGNQFYPNCGDFSEYKRQGAKIALWHAGGNWGDLWRIAQDVRIKTFKDLLAQGFTVIGMPQSLHYESKDLEKQDVQVMKENIAAGLGLSSPSALNKNPGKKESQSRLIFTWREEESFEKAKKLYPFADNRLMPDIAFQIGPYAPIRPTDLDSLELKDIMLLLRDDHESTVLQDRSEYSIQEMLEKNPKGKGITFVMADWPKRLDIFGLSTNPVLKEYLFSDSAIKLLSLGRVVVGDRLHAAVLAYLSGLTVVYIDQKTKKISKTLGVAFESLDKCRDGKASRWFRAETLEEALGIAIDLSKEEAKNSYA